MRRSITLFGVLAMVLMATWALGQARTGSIYGTVTDSDGNPLPGVTVTLEGPNFGRQSVVTDIDGSYRFPSLPPGRGYTLTFELDGFKTVVQKDIEVRVAVNTKVDAVMQIGGGEEIVVGGTVPVVDVKSVSVGTNLTRDELQTLPTARDPWVMLELAPGIMVDRENVGGSESGQQSIFMGRGDDGDNAQWNLDGITFTDPGAIGASPAYYDFDAFEEMQINTAGGDVEQFTGGININFVTRRAGNRLVLGGRFFWTDEDFGSSNDEDHRDEFLNPTASNKVDQVLDFGGQIGGPIVKDKLWFWGAYGGQRIDLQAQGGQIDSTNLDNFNAKVNAQLGAHMVEGYFFFSNKTKNGRGAAANRPPETTMDQDGPSPFFKLQDEFFATDNLFISVKAGLGLGGFNLEPKGGRNVPVTFDLNTGLFGGTWFWAEIDRPTFDITGNAIYYLNDRLGGDHEIKVGAEYRWGQVETAYNFGNGVFAITYSTALQQALGVFGEVDLLRESNTDLRVRRFSAWIQDTYTTGRLTILAGLRFDRQDNSIADAVSPALDVFGELSARFLAASSGSPPDPGFSWNTFSPRVGITYDVTGDAKTLIKGSFGLYPSTLGIDQVFDLAPSKQIEADFFWIADLNGDGLPQANEIDFSAPIFADFDLNDPNRIVNTIDPDLPSPKTLEFTLGIEREVIKDFGVALTGFYRRLYDFNWAFPYDPDGNITENDIFNCWSQAGTIPAEFGGFPFYQCSVPRPAGVKWTERMDFNRQYLGLELRFVKRMSHRWMLNGSVTIQDWSSNFDGPRSFIDPTNVEQLDGNATLVETGGSGRSDVFPNARWMVKLGGVVRLPYDVNFGATFIAREGYPIAPFYTAPRVSNGWGSTVNVLIGEPDDNRLEDFWTLNLRLEKMISLGEYGRLYLSADGFNIFNNDTILGRQREATSQNFMKITEILAPRVFRFGARYEF